MTTRIIILIVVILIIILIMVIITVIIMVIIITITIRSWVFDLIYLSGPPETSRKGIRRQMVRETELSVGKHRVFSIACSPKYIVYDIQLEHRWGSFIVSLSVMFICVWGVLFQFVYIRRDLRLIHKLKECIGLP